MTCGLAAIRTKSNTTHPYDGINHFSNFKFQHKFAEHRKPVLTNEVLLNVTAVLEAEKELPPETKRNSGPKNELGIYKKSCSLSSLVSCFYMQPLTQFFKLFTGVVTLCNAGPPFSL
jgi:hypothetical protein